ncbi:MAG TPA: ACP S-malonyltransferase [Gemmatimonadales bacterium]|nr:ACP S-malonyltransferase [Gemmatimonadales bacterium]
MKVLLFPGQGAQKVGMAADLAAAFPAARATLQAIDSALGVSLSTLMAEGPEGELQLTHNTQPAILAHSAAVLAVVGDRLADTACAAGHSLGEYSAWVAAGAFDAPTAAKLVRRRGELMFAAGQARPGAMAAILGLGTAEVEAACAGASAGDSGVAVAANLNAPDQTVISGDPAAVERAGELCKAAGAKRVMGLKVSGAFHSPLMEPAVDGLKQALAAASFATPTFPVIANAVARPVDRADEAVQLLADQLTAPVRWVECMRTAAEFAPEATFVEIGPGNVLSGLIKRIVPTATTVTLGTAKEVEAFLA